MRSCWAFPVLLAFAGIAHAGEMRRYALMQVAPSSIWFQDKAKLERWQALKTAGDAAKLAAYQDGLLQAREAWQFTAPLSVRLLAVAPRAHLVRVELQTEGRLRGSTWMLDADALMPVRESH